MTELEALQKLITEGYQPFMVLRTVPDQEKHTRLPQLYWGQEVYALPLGRPNGDRKMFYMIEEDTVAYARELVDDARTIIGYDGCIYCSVLGRDTVGGRQVSLETLLESISDIRDWEVSVSEYPNTFEIEVTIDSGAESLLQDAIVQVEGLARLLSLKNRVGVIISSVSPGARYRAQPFSLKMGLEVRGLEGLDPTDLEALERLSSDDECILAADALRDIYSQVNNRAQIASGWATIEELFETSPQHCLSKGEIQAVCDKLQELNLEEDKLGRITERMKSSSIMATNSRNDRIAQGIAELLDSDEQSAAKRVRHLASTRGKLLHRLSNEQAIKEDIEFIEEVLHAYIREHCGVTF